MKIEDFAGTGPEFRPEEFYHGRFEGWGLLEGPMGGFKGRFTVAAEGRRHADGRGVDFTETWTFDDDHVDRLNWTIKALGDGRYAGTETRIVGEAEGRQAGCAFHWRYTRDTPQPDGGSHKLTFDDWFWRVGETGLFARGRGGPLGAPVAGAHVCYRKL